MEKIVKNFVQNYESHDCEAREHEWVDVTLTYEEAKARCNNAWCEGARMVEKTFDPETFKITTKVVKTWEKTKKTGTYRWDYEEKIF